jgi:hypothetical protein
LIVSPSFFLGVPDLFMLLTVEGLLRFAIQVLLRFPLQKVKEKEMETSEPGKRALLSLKSKETW